MVTFSNGGEPFCDDDCCAEVASLRSKGRTAREVSEDSLSLSKLALTIESLAHLIANTQRSGIVLLRGANKVVVVVIELLEFASTSVNLDQAKQTLTVEWVTRANIDDGSELVLRRHKVAIQVEALPEIPLRLREAWITTKIVVLKQGEEEQSASLIVLNEVGIPSLCEALRRESRATRQGTR